MRAGISFLTKCVPFQTENYGWKLTNDLINSNFTLCEKEGRVGGHVKFGIAILIPVILSILFTFPHWKQLEDTRKKKICTMPLLLIQCWPQYRNLRILYLSLWKKDKRWKTEREIIERDISSLGKTISLQKIS